MPTEEDKDLDILFNGPVGAGDDDAIGDDDDEELDEDEEDEDDEDAE